MLDQLMIGGLTIVLVVFLAYYLIVFISVRPIEQTREQVIELVEEKTNMKTVESFNIVTTDKTYYSLLGKNELGEDIAVAVPKDAGAIYEIRLSEGVEMSSLPQENATTIDFAVFKDKPVWEVNTKTDFKIYDFVTGEQL